MFAHYFRGLADDGLLSSSTDVTSDGPLEMYGKLGFIAGDELVKLTFVETEPPAATLNYRTEPISAGEAARYSRPDLPGSNHWTRRPEFRQRLARNLTHLGVSAPGGLAGFATLEPRAHRTLALDYHLPEPEVAAALTRFLFDNGFPQPVIFPAAHPDTASCASLVECGYIVTGRFRSMTLDLTRPNHRLSHLYRSFPELPLRDERNHA
jgi:hypothetical protein